MSPASSYLSRPPLPAGGAAHHMSSQQQHPTASEERPHQDVILTHDLVQEGVAGAKVGRKNCVLISRAAALHLQAVHPGMMIQATAF